MDSFAANYIIPSVAEGSFAITPLSQNLSCPICQQSLTRAAGDNIPDTVHVWKCPEAHGYFFPSGQLTAFKKAQKSKIEYHKLWNLPLPSAASVLLAGIGFLILAGGLFASLSALQNRQTSVSQAQNILVAEHAYVVADNHEVLFTGETEGDATLTIFIPAFANFRKNLATRDQRTYTLLVEHIPSGTYRYFFSITIRGRTIPSETYSFTMP